MNLLGVLEGILFVVGDEGITLNAVCEIMNIEPEEAPAYFRMCSFKYICVRIRTYFFFFSLFPAQLNY